MEGGRRLVTAGVVGRPHGLDGGFYVERVEHPLAAGTVVRVAARALTVRRRAGTDRRPLVHLDGVEDRAAAVALRGELLLVEDRLGEGEWLAADLVGCRVPGLGTVARVIAAPSCDVLELDDGRLVPLVADAVRRVDVDAAEIEVDRGFLGLADEGSAAG